MIHEAYMPVYMGSRFLARDGTGPIEGSTRGPRGPKKILPNICSPTVERSDITVKCAGDHSIEQVL